MTRVARRVALTAGLIFLAALAFGCWLSNTQQSKEIPRAQSIQIATSEQTAIPTVSPSPAAPSTAAQPPPDKDSQDFLTNKTLKRGDALFDSLVKPLANEASRRRAERAKHEPDYAQRVDSELNEGRINFLLFGYGETHEPPLTEKAIIGSQTIVSYDTRTRQADIISLTHDIRAPEIERELVKRGMQKVQAIRIDQAYSVGGFKLMRLVMEDATGLSMDYQVTFKDATLQRLIDGVFGGIDVDVPMAFDVHPFYLDGVKYEKGTFAEGVQRLGGRQVIQFIKTVPIYDGGGYRKALEHNARKALVFDALLASINKHYREHQFWLRGSAFLTGELVSKSIVYDFDPVSLMVNNIGNTVAILQKSTGKEPYDLRLPKINRQKYIVDPAHGDGGVQWINANAAVNPITQRDIEAGVYSSSDMEVPINADPHGDLVTGYWPSVRALVKDTLSGTGSH